MTYVLGAKDVYDVLQSGGDEPLDVLVLECLSELDEDVPLELRQLLHRCLVDGGGGRASTASKVSKVVDELLLRMKERSTLPDPENAGPASALTTLETTLPPIVVPTNARTSGWLASVSLLLVAAGCSLALGFGALHLIQISPRGGEETPGVRTARTSSETSQGTSHLEPQTGASSPQPEGARASSDANDDVAGAPVNATTEAPESIEAPPTLTGTDESHSAQTPQTRPRIIVAGPKRRRPRARSPDSEPSKPGSSSVASDSAGPAPSTHPRQVDGPDSVPSVETDDQAKDPPSQEASRGAGLLPVGESTKPTSPSKSGRHHSPLLPLEE